MPALKERHRDEDDDGFAAVSDVDLEESWCQHDCCPVPTASSCNHIDGPNA